VDGVASPPGLVREIAARAHEHGMEVVLEVASATPKGERRAVETAGAIGADWVLGGCLVEEALAILRGTAARYLPCAGGMIGIPGRLARSVPEIAYEAARLTDMPGVHGIGLLSYSHIRAGASELTRAVVEYARGPVVAAGPIDSPAQVRELEAAGAWACTVTSGVLDQLLLI
jgi:indole-3-glycerol phosphate synthase